MMVYLISELYKILEYKIKPPSSITFSNQYLDLNHCFQVSANNIFLGKTKVVDNQTTVNFNETFMFKTSSSLNSIKIMFELRDKDDIGDDDHIGSVSLQGHPAIP